MPGMTNSIGLKAGFTLRILVLLAVSTAGCSGVHIPEVPQARYLKRELLHRIETNSVPRKDVLSELGVPDRKFDNGRILGYRISLKGDEARSAMRAKGRYHLILLFGADDVVERYSLVREYP